MRNPISHKSLYHRQKSNATAQPTRVVNFKKDPTIILAKEVEKISKYPSGAGGLGDVWMCSWRQKSWVYFESQKSWKRTAAVKSIRIPQADDIEKIGKRIRREAHVWIDLDHDSILKFLGIIEDFGLLPALIFPRSKH
ncbi:hypothetical protein AZE42_09948 [Rhizopogon vesiculosus]|uniref:Protein kinase domain-containing protein n=1 Tax=Rhizopogon vesiculosus TaxID=180088 RepID=A0A1J8PX32_9AGAM|nr:hypothetical protein AZE42_09948 [Rhizopogon vesiculosus]